MRVVDMNIAESFPGAFRFDMTVFIEVDIGMSRPEPELVVFRLPMSRENKLRHIGKC
jgi:hypothetical protein